MYTIPQPPLAKTIGELRVEAGGRYSVSPDNLTISRAGGKVLDDAFRIADVDFPLHVNIKEAGGEKTTWYVGAPASPKCWCLWYRGVWVHYARH